MRIHQCINKEMLLSTNRSELVRWICTITIALLLLSCGNKSKQRIPSLDVKEEVGELCQEELHDTIDNSDTEHTMGNKTKPTKTGSHTSSSKDNDCYDNMRGFDPSSEDDMDDNGMSRYMENNDEEGWD